MIKNIILPEKIGSNYLFSKRIIGFDITRTHVTATQILLNGSTVTIEQCVEEKLEKAEVGVVEYQERVTHAIKNIINQMPSYNEIRTAISSSVVIFKELHMPFSNHEQLKMAVEFEVDPLLPFSVKDAIVDFIITKVNKEDNSADILVAAVQKHHIAQHLEIFEAAGVDVRVITVDLFALYGLYKRIPEFQTTLGDIAFVDVGTQTTGIGYLKDGQLSYIRSLPRGITSIAKAISTELKLQPGQAIGDIVRFGVKKEDDPNYNEAAARAIRQFWKEVQFTLSSFSRNDQEPKSENAHLEEKRDEKKQQEEGTSKSTSTELQAVEDQKSNDQKETESIKDTHKKEEIKANSLQPKQSTHEEKRADVKIMLFGIATDIEGLCDFLRQDLSVDCTVFNVGLLAKDPSVTIKSKNPILSTQMMSVSIALPSQELEFFNMRQKEFAPPTASLLLKQLVAGGSFLCLLFGSLIAFYVVQVQTLKKEANDLEQETVIEIKERFKSIDPDEDNLQDVFESAEKEVGNQEKLLSAFLRSSSSSVLTYLLELTKRLNQQALGLQVSQIAINDERIIFRAKVKDYEALKILEYELAQSPLFKTIPPQEDPKDINMEIMLTKGKSHGTH